MPQLLMTSVSMTPLESCINRTHQQKHRATSKPTQHQKSYPFLQSSASMKPKSKHAPNNPDESSFLWNWKENANKKQKKKSKNSGNQFPVVEFLQENYRKVEENVLGPGAGLGIGCGMGLGVGLVGGVGYGGWPWNHVKVVFGFGMGCGVGLGFGFGRGLGYGCSWDSLQSYVFDRKPDAKNKRILIDY